MQSARSHGRDTDVTKVYCKYCQRLYKTGADQCDIPNFGIYQIEELRDYHRVVGDVSDFVAATGNTIDEKIVNGYTREQCKDFIIEKLSNSRSIYPHINGNKEKIYGHPSIFNKDNDCIFYKPENKIKASRLHNLADNPVIMGILMSLLMLSGAILASKIISIIIERGG